MTEKPKFPPLPHWLVAGRSDGVPRALRPFGDTGDDLVVDFPRSRKPELITELLERCGRADGGRPVDRQLLLEMPVGLRIESLLALAELADPTPFSWRVPCAAGCGKESEFDLTVDQIVASAREEVDRATIGTEVAGIQVDLRRPTGLDQSQWIDLPVQEQAEAMLRSILVHPSLDELLAAGATLEAVVLAVDEVMDRFDPLPSFNLRVVCAHCGGSTAVAPDLIGSALERLAFAQQSMIEEVHRLASRYHWSERQILELPTWRRRCYLERIEGAAT